ncbi:MAG: biotin--[acetyl-CoA-carboxylase] ligase [Bacteroidota bacterium]
MHPKNTIFIGKVLHHFDVLPSTNTYAQELLSKSRPADGTAIITDHQYQGRGQIGTTWDSEAGQNITLSVILYPKFLQARQQFLLSQAIAIGVSSFIAELVEKEVWIKWPNDIYIEDRKVCGLLIQNAISGRSLQNAIIGIGINLNQTQFADQLKKATSIAIETGRHHTVFDILPDLFQAIERNYLLLRKGEYDSIRELYLKRLYRYQTWQQYEDNSGQIFRGRILGVSEQGELQIQSEVETIRSFALKEIKFL